MKFLLVTLVVFSLILSSAFTQTTTTAPETTTAAPVPKKPILSFNSTCLKVNMSVDFEFTYEAMINGTSRNESVTISLSAPLNYNINCTINNETNTLSIDFNTNWNLLFEYVLDSKQEYSLKTVNLVYEVNKDQFPNVSNSSLGRVNASATDLKAFAATKGNSYKCSAETNIKLDRNVTVNVTNYIAQPFLDGKNPDFSTAVECSADTVGTSKLVPIIVGSALAVLVILVLVAYIIGRRKHRPGYQQV